MHFDFMNVLLLQWFEHVLTPHVAIFSVACERTQTQLKCV
jgi:hypothetical protein